MTESQRQIDFYFDYLSPYAFLAWHGIRPLAEAEGVRLVLHPTLLGSLLAHYGHLGPAEIPPKRKFVMRDVARLAARAGIEMRAPKAHPFNPLLALRLSMIEVAGERQHELVELLWRATWQESRDVSDEAEMAAVLSSAGFDASALIGATKDASIKARLKEHVDSHIALGVFGVPTFLVSGELFWGYDQLGHLTRFLRGEDPLDPALAAALESMPVGMSRRR